MRGKAKINNLPSLYEILGPAPPYIKAPKERGKVPKASDANSFFTILVDTREQEPFLFKSYPCWAKRQCLKTGDYSIAGFEELVSVERKSKKDLYTSL